MSDMPERLFVYRDDAEDEPHYIAGEHYDEEDTEYVRADKISEWDAELTGLYTKVSELEVENSALKDKLERISGKALELVHEFAALEEQTDE